MTKSAEEAWDIVHKQDEANVACSKELRGSARERYIKQVQCMKGNSVKVKG